MQGYPCIPYTTFSQLTPHFLTPPPFIPLPTHTNLTIFPIPLTSPCKPTIHAYLHPSSHSPPHDLPPLIMHLLPPLSSPPLLPLPYLIILISHEDILSMQTYIHTLLSSLTLHPHSLPYLSSPTTFLPTSPPHFTLVTLLS